MRHHRRVRKARTFLALLVVAALAATGCGDSTSTEAPEPDRSQIDAAYGAVATAQFANAVGYSDAILKTTTDPEIKKFAQSVIAQREEWSAMIDESQPEDLTKAAETLAIPLESLGVTADGTPLAAPSSDAGYLSAMKLNNQASVRAAEVANTQLADQVIQGASEELSEIEQLQK
jgi:hypothetical protein